MIRSLDPSPYRCVSSAPASKDFFRILAQCVLLEAALVLSASAAGGQTAHYKPSIVTLGGGFSGPTGVSVDGGGNVYVADALHNAVKKIPAGCASSACVATLGGGFSNPYGVAVDVFGNVYVAVREPAPPTAPVMSTAAAIPAR